MTDSIQLVIKAPNQKVSDQTIDCELNWTVLQLKTHLSVAYPTKPKIEDQKLIYSGHMLLDNLTLKNVLRNDTGQKHTLHLVCASSNVTQSPSQNTQNVENEGNFNSNATSQQGTPGTSLHYRGVRQNGENFTNVSHNEIPQFPVTGGQPLNPELMAQQMAAMQQFYAQYMAQIMQNAQMAGIGTYPNIAFSPVFTPASGVPVNPGFAPAPVENPNVPPRANANAPPPAANANVRMNAQGGAVLEEDEEDAENRDWLDWFYIVCRAVVLFSVVYFYSSLGRFMVVFGLAILIYMYQGGWFGQRPAPQPNAEANQPVAPNQNEQPQNEPQLQENEEAVSSPNLQDNAENEAQIQEELREIQQLMDGDMEPRHTARPEQSLVKLFWSTFTSFFTSMIPEQPPPPVNVN